MPPYEYSLPQAKSEKVGMIENFFGYPCFLCLQCSMKIFSIALLPRWYLTPTFDIFLRLLGSTFPTYKIFSLFYTPFVKACSFSSATCLVEWIKDILLIIGVTFLTGSCFSRSLSESSSSGSAMFFPGDDNVL